MLQCWDCQIMSKLSRILLWDVEKRIPKTIACVLPPLRQVTVYKRVEAMSRAISINKYIYISGHPPPPWSTDPLQTLQIPMKTSMFAWSDFGHALISDLDCIKTWYILVPCTRLIARTETNIEIMDSCSSCLWSGSCLYKFPSKPCKFSTKILESWIPGFQLDSGLYNFRIKSNVNTKTLESSIPGFSTGFWFRDLTYWI